MQYNDDKQQHKKVLPTRKFRFYLKPLRILFDDSINDKNKRFNKKQVTINPNGTFTEKYWWDDEKERQKKLEFANIYHGWLNERLMSAIFDYEQENDLLSYSTDEEGEKEYLPSWDNGIFSFLIKDNKLESEIILIKDNQERHVALPLQDRLIKSILNHHEVTNNELSDEWQPWNKMVIDSPYEGIFLDMDDHIIYSMVEDEV